MNRTFSLKLSNIHKSFASNNTKALSTADFEAREAEIHALLGENGAGKSTLMRIAAGYIKPDTGNISVDGKTLVFSSPSDALKAGIGMVPQDPKPTYGFALWEDCTLGSAQGLFINKKKTRRLVQEQSDRLGFDLKADERTENMSVSRRQKAAVLALLLRNVKYFIFDEPTAVLSPPETELLFNLFKSLKAEGAGIVLISHKLNETLALSDRVTVIKQGKTVLSGSTDSVNKEKLDEELFGAKITSQYKIKKSACNSPILIVRELGVENESYPFLRGISCEAHSATILGIAGVRDSGLRTFEYAVTGALKADFGSILLEGKAVTSIRGFRQAGGAYLSSDGSSVSKVLPLRDTLIIHLHHRSLQGPLGKLGIMNGAFLNSKVKEIMEEAGVVRPYLARTDSCSGGMIQRLALARELLEKSRLLVLSEPAKGLDISSRKQFYNLIQSYVEGEGRPSVLLFSTDLDEITELADEILVVHNGGIVGRMKRCANRKRIVEYMTRGR